MFFCDPWSFNNLSYYCFLAFLYSPRDNAPRNKLITHIFLAIIASFFMRVLPASLENCNSPPHFLENIDKVPFPYLSVPD